MWQPVDDFLEAFPPACLSHGLCPDCVKRHYSQDYIVTGT